MSPGPRQASRLIAFMLATAVVFLVIGVWPITHYFPAPGQIVHLFEYAVESDAAPEQSDWAAFLDQEQAKLQDLAQEEDASLSESLRIDRVNTEDARELHLVLSALRTDRLPVLDNYLKCILRRYRSYRSDLERAAPAKVSAEQVPVQEQQQRGAKLQRQIEHELDLLQETRQQAVALNAQYDRLLTEIATREQQLWDPTNERFARFAQGLSRPKDMLWQAYQQQIRREIKQLQKDQAAFPERKTDLVENEKVYAENIIAKVRQLKALKIKPPPPPPPPPVPVPTLDFDWTVRSKQSDSWQWIVFAAIALLGGLVGWLLEKATRTDRSRQAQSSKTEPIIFSEPIVMKSASLRESSNMTVGADETLKASEDESPYVATHMETQNQHVVIEEIEEPPPAEAAKTADGLLDEIESSEEREAPAAKNGERTDRAETDTQVESPDTTKPEKPSSRPVERIVPSSRTETLVDKFLGRPDSSQNASEAERMVLPAHSSEATPLPQERSTTREDTLPAPERTLSEENVFDTTAQPGQLQQCEPFAQAIENLHEHTACPIILISALKPDQASPRFAADLAIVLQRRRQRVLLVEADADSQVLAEKVFDVACEPGFYEWRRGAAWVRQVSSETHLRDVTFMPSGTVTAEQGVTDLDLDRETHRWSNLRHNYDVVLLYCPSALLPKPKTVQQRAAAHLRHLIDGLFTLTSVKNTGKVERQLQTRYPHLASQLLSVVAVK